MSDYVDSLDESVQAIRETVKWIFGIAAGLGAFVVADLNVLEVAQMRADSLRSWFGWLAAATALGAVGRIMLLASSCLVGRYTTLRDVLRSIDHPVKRLRRVDEFVETRLAEETDFLYGGLAHDLNGLWRLRRQRNRLGVRSNQGAELALEARLDLAEKRVVSFASYVATTYRYRRLMDWVRYGGAVIAIMMTIVVLTVNGRVSDGSDTVSTLVPALPVAIDYLAPEALSALRASAECDAVPLDRAEVIARFPGGIVIQTPPTNDCQSASLAAASSGIVVTSR